MKALLMVISLFFSLGLCYGEGVMPAAGGHSDSTESTSLFPGNQSLDVSSPDRLLWIGGISLALIFGVWGYCWFIKFYIDPS
tara:strand:+ start:124 stop:369 length:246 start_codon:yes stop_codon:yes gene_type:complete